MKNKVELLAPAGDIECAYAAISAGCDAIYLGGKMYNARANATNFTNDQILEIIKIAHINNVKVYVTINILIKNKEFDNNLYEYLKFLYINKVDGLIVCDVGLIRFIKTFFPKFKIHISTQSHITSFKDIEFFSKLGIDRVVLSRELSLSEIESINQKTDIETECFIHGSMCYAYSGRCFFSSAMGLRSANRGECAGPCRLKYKYNNTELYYLNMKDMCVIDEIGKLINAGVTSFKIEGRMKDKNYVFGVTSIYRKYIDDFINNGKVEVSYSDSKRLKQRYIRGENQANYLHMQNGKEMISLEKGGYNKEVKDLQIPDVKNKLEIFGNIKLKAGSKAVLEVSYKNIKVTSYGEVISKANNKPVSKNEIIDRISKTGDYNFTFSNISVDMDENIFVSNGGINRLRRNALDELEKKIFTRDEIIKEFYKKEFTSIKDTDNKEKYSCLINSFEQFNEVLNSNFFNRVYIEWDVYFDNLKNFDLLNKSDIEIYLALPYVVRENKINYFLDKLKSINKNIIGGFLVRTNSELDIIKEMFEDMSVVLDLVMNIWNGYSLDFYTKKYNSLSLTAPVELSYKENKDINKVNSEIVVYGHCPVMISANCIYKTNDKCSQISDTVYLRDRKSSKLIINNVCKFCYNIMYNSRPVELVDKKELLDNYEYKRFNFICESRDEIKQIISNYKKGIHTNSEYTLGHYNKGVI